MVQRSHIFLQLLISISLFSSTKVSTSPFLTTFVHHRHHAVSRSFQRQVVRCPPFPALGMFQGYFTVVRGEETWHPEGTRPPAPSKPPPTVKLTRYCLKHALPAVVVPTQPGVIGTDLVRPSVIAGIDRPCLGPNHTRW